MMQPRSLRRRSASALPGLLPPAPPAPAHLARAPRRARDPVRQAAAETSRALAAAIPSTPPRCADSRRLVPLGRPLRPLGLEPCLDLREALTAFLVTQPRAGGQEQTMLATRAPGRV